MINQAPARSKSGGSLKEKYEKKEKVKMAPNGYKWLQMAPDGSKLLQMAPSSSTWLQMATNDSKWFQIVPMAPN